MYNGNVIYGFYVSENQMEYIPYITAVSIPCPIRFSIPPKPFSYMPKSKALSPTSQTKTLSCVNPFLKDTQSVQALELDDWAAQFK